jgi:hypothetical protein
MVAPDDVSPPTAIGLRERCDVHHQANLGHQRTTSMQIAPTECDAHSHERPTANVTGGQSLVTQGNPGVIVH